MHFRHALVFSQKPFKLKREVGPLVHFDELVYENTHVQQSNKEEDDFVYDAYKNCHPPDTCALFLVTVGKNVNLVVVKEITLLFMCC